MFLVIVIASSVERYKKERAVLYLDLVSAHFPNFAVRNSWCEIMHISPVSFMTRSLPAKVLHEWHKLLTGQFAPEY